MHVKSAYKHLSESIPSLDRGELLAHWLHPSIALGKPFFQPLWYIARQMSTTVFGVFVRLQVSLPLEFIVYHSAPHFLKFSTQFFAVFMFSIRYLLPLCFQHASQTSLNRFFSGPGLWKDKGNELLRPQHGRRRRYLYGGNPCPAAPIMQH